MPQNDFKSPGTVIGNYVSVKFYIGEAAYKKCQDGEKQLIDSLSSLYAYLWSSTDSKSDIDLGFL